MGNYVLYLLMQAFVTMIFAYFSGTLALRVRKLSMVLVSLGFYLLMGSALVELWGDRGGWETWAVGLNAALVATGVAVMGAGTLLKEAPGLRDPSLAETLARSFVGASTLMGGVLAVAARSSIMVVDAGSAAGIEISGAYSHLDVAGWALGAHLFIGAILLVWLGVRTTLTRSDVRGLWSVVTGALFLVWPFDLDLGGVHLSPSILMLSVAAAYFAYLPPKEKEEVGVDYVEDRPGVVDDETGKEDLSPWVREAIAEQALKDIDEKDE